MQSYDATTHFETTVKDVVQLYSKMTGKVRIFLVNIQLKLRISLHTIIFSEFENIEKSERTGIVC